MAWDKDFVVTSRGLWKGGVLGVTGGGGKGQGGRRSKAVTVVEEEEEEDCFSWYCGSLGYGGMVANCHCHLLLVSVGIVFGVDVGIICVRSDRCENFT